MPGCLAKKARMEKEDLERRHLTYAVCEAEVALAELLVQVRHWLAAFDAHRHGGLAQPNAARCDRLLLYSLDHLVRLEPPARNDRDARRAASGYLAKRC